MSTAPHRRSLLLAGLLAAACRTGSPVAPPPAPSPAATAAPSPAAPAPAAMPDSLHWVRNSAEYRAAAIQAYGLAGDQLERLARDKRPGTWAVILDADETVLDNSQYQKERATQGLRFTPQTWHEWVGRKQAGAIPGARDFLRKVREKRGKIAIVTNRAVNECADTEANFKSLDLPHDVILCWPMPGPSEKEPRFESVAAGTASPGLPALEVLMWVGDNIQDFPQQRQALRGQPDEAFRDFGRRFIVIPNPVYGSWERLPRQ